VLREADHVGPGRRIDLGTLDANAEFSVYLPGVASLVAGDLIL
jgi:hypothetical protein